MEDTPPPATPPDAPTAGPDEIRRLVLPPAIGMISLTALSVLFNLLELIFHPMAGLLEEIFRGVPSDLDHAMGFFGVSATLFGFAISAVVLVGSFMMLQLRSWPLSLAAAILMMIPCLGPCCPLGIPVGVWALIILLKPEVRQVMERNG